MAKLLPHETLGQMVQEIVDTAVMTVVLMLRLLLRRGPAREGKGAQQRSEEEAIHLSPQMLIVGRWFDSYIWLACDPLKPST